MHGLPLSSKVFESSFLIVFQITSESSDNVPLSAQEASALRASMEASLSVASEPGTLANGSQ